MISDGVACAAFDVAVNSTFFKNNCNELLISTIIEGIANKYDTELNENGKVDLLRVLI